ncbi:MAG: hypothetical protein OEM67_00810 [Thermoleophilia bacterium]|nr:hypothetical protein [Thermoleophilia bacterium]MDH3725585.1 hypothetical protein [Thermoleophilia bacterium]
MVEVVTELVLIRLTPSAGTPSTATEVQLTVIASGAPVADVNGVGRALAARLASAGLPTVGDLALSDAERIRAAIGGSLERALKLRAAAVGLNRPSG